MPGKEVTFSVSKAQFFGGVITILASVAAFGLTMRSDVTENQRELRLHKESIAEIKQTQKADLAAQTEVKVRLARIETMLEQALKSMGDKIVKAQEEIRDLQEGSR